MAVAGADARVTDEDRAALLLVRRIRAASRDEYERFFRLAVRSLAVAEMIRDDHLLVDLTEQSGEDHRLC